MDPKFPSETLENIFQNLETAHLFSAVLANRSWCAAGIPVLWRSPFAHFGCLRGRERSGLLLLQTYISCMNKEAKERLVENGFPLTIESTTDETRSNSISTSTREAIFNYPSFLRTFDYSGIDSVAHYWTPDTKKAANATSTDLNQELCKLFISESTAIMKFDVFIFNINVFQLVGAKECFSRVKRFACSLHKCQEEILQSASEIMRDLESIVVDPCCEDDKGLASLISAQRNLKHLVVYDVGNKLPLVMAAIKTQVPVIRELELSRITYYPCDLLEGCENLERLTFTTTNHLDIDHISKIKFRKLTELTFRTNFFLTHATFDSLLRSTNKKLELLDFAWVLHGHDADVDDEKFSLLKECHFTRIIAKHCPNLKSLHLVSDERTLRELEIIFKACPKLEHLSFKPFIESQIIDITKYFPQWGPIFPTTMKSFDVDSSGGEVFTADDLEFFLESATKRLRNCLELILPISIDASHYAVLEQYGREEASEFDDSRVRFIIHPAFERQELLNVSCYNILQD